MPKRVVVFGTIGLTSRGRCIVHDSGCVMRRCKRTTSVFGKQGQS